MQTIIIKSEIGTESGRRRFSIAQRAGLSKGSPDTRATPGLEIALLEGLTIIDAKLKTLS